MLFMGQEFGTSNPFLYFADHCEDALVESVHKGRKEFLAQFPSYGSAEAQEAVPDPCSPSTFEHSKLDFSERVTHAPFYLFHQDLLRLRREDPLITRQDRKRLDGAVLEAVGKPELRSATGVEKRCSKRQLPTNTTSKVGRDTEEHHAVLANGFDGGARGAFGGFAAGAQGAPRGAGTSTVRRAACPQGNFVSH